MEDAESLIKTDDGYARVDQAGRRRPRIWTGLGTTMVLRLRRVVEYIWYEDLQCSPVRRDGGQHGLSANSNLWRDMRERERDRARDEESGRLSRGCVFHQRCQRRQIKKTRREKIK
jgi:hypothetical protein